MGPAHLLTKGDNNPVDDKQLYAPGQRFLNQSTDIVGTVIGYVPCIGYIACILGDFPILKPLMVTMTVLVVLLK